MSNMQYSITEILELAKQTARKSDVKYKVACILVDKRGRVVSVGYNHHSVNSKRLHQYTIHAECDALNKVRKPSTNLTAFLYRENNNPIHMCHCCATLMKAYGITEVISMHTLELEG